MLLMMVLLIFYTTSSYMSSYEKDTPLRSLGRIKDRRTFTEFASSWWSDVGIQARCIHSGSSSSSGGVGVSGGGAPPRPYPSATASHSPPRLRSRWGLQSWALVSPARRQLFIWPPWYPPDFCGPSTFTRPDLARGACGAAEAPEGPGPRDGPWG